MSACIIQKKNLEKLGKKVMKEFYYHIHNDHLLKDFEEVRLKRKYYDENLTKYFLDFYKKEEENINRTYFDDKSFKDLLEMKTEDLLKKIETKILDETLEVEIIHRFLDMMDVKVEISNGSDFELDEDLFCMKKAFINIYNIFHYDNHYLED